MIEALSIADIEAALPRVREGLAPYLWLQSHRDTCDVRRDTEFRRRFNHFYRVRRGREWQDSFYALLERNKRHPASFETVLRALHRSTRQWEASFASKLVATVDPEMPVIDSAVLRNLGLRLPTRTSHSRAEQIIELHDQLAATLREMLDTEFGRHVVTRFRAEYPEAEIATIKMLDLVLWKAMPSGAQRAT